MWINIVRLTLALLSCFDCFRIVLGQCYYSLDMKFGSSYYLPSPGYPLKYPPNTKCSYRITAPYGYRIDFNCNEFQIPSTTTGCRLDTFRVSLTGREDLSDAYTFCGAGVIREKSVANSMFLQLQAAPKSQGGKFLCTMSIIPQSCSCGKKKLTKIVNGIETKVNEFPMMAAMIDVKTRIVVCGASIISDFYALTAAHCLLQRTVDDTALLVGDHNLTTGLDTGFAQAYIIAQFLSHTAFLVNPVSNDIALLRTLQQIQFNNGVSPVCLPWKFRGDSFEGAVVEAVGWGDLDFGGPKSKVLMKVALNVINNQQCSTQLNTTITYQKLCTYTPTKDTCQSDSGGPLFYTAPSNGLLYEVGIVSYGIACATSNPSVNTRVTEFLDWIMANTPNAFYCFQ
ncbi:venom serine protease-like isoform X2 [Uranotaenia lowii]|uniref:venom serine protease-like isoform X2 n=1 Tax=Uranotaenia lowii TaxID=190385 RepID=UPI0024796E8E|nr:venom serine protease-like isoform X2 [Uranotaenia lowii]